MVLPDASCLSEYLECFSGCFVEFGLPKCGSSISGNLKRVCWFGDVVYQYSLTPAPIFGVGCARGIVDKIIGGSKWSQAVWVSRMLR